MRIVYIVAGAGGMYCGACARDVNLVRELIALGHDVEVVTLYTPLRTDEVSAMSSAPIYYGGINAYLQQISPIFRHTPAVLDRLLDSPALLNWASKFAIRTRAEDLGPMTVSVLAGKNGRQKKELKKLLGYIQAGPKPDVINITNSLLSGIAPELKARLNVPIVCTLQGEDGFVGVMPEPYRSKAQGLMRENSRAIDLFVSPGENYADRMSGFLSTPLDRIRVIHAGTNVRTYAHDEPRARSPFVLGYLSVITRSKGLDLLVNAFVALAKGQERDVVLLVAGKVLDHSYWSALEERVASEHLSARFVHLGEVDLAGKITFLRQCSAFCVPSRIEESRGMAVMEAMASGVPVVVPDSGVFPEMMSLTEGGVLFPPGDAGALAGAIARLMDDPDRADALGRSGAAGIERFYNAEQMAEQTLAAYSSLLQ